MRFTSSGAAQNSWRKSIARAILKPCFWIALAILCCHTTIRLRSFAWRWPKPLWLQEGTKIFSILKKYTFFAHLSYFVYQYTSTQKHYTTLIKFVILLKYCRRILWPFTYFYGLRMRTAFGIQMRFIIKRVSSNITKRTNMTTFVHVHVNIFIPQYYA